MLKGFVWNRRWGGLPWWLSGKETACQCRRPRFDPWVGKIPWRTKWQPTPVFLPGESHGQRSLAGYSPWGHKDSDMTEWVNSSIRGETGRETYMPQEGFTHTSCAFRAEVLRTGQDFRRACWPELKISGFKILVRPLSSIRCWAIYFISLNLCFLFCKMGLVAVVVR